MNKINIINIPIYEFECDAGITEEVLAEVKTLNYTVKTGSGITNEIYFHKKLFDWFDICVEEIRKIYYTDAAKLAIVAAWVNKTSKLQNINMHLHSNSLISGCFYLTTHNSAEIEFRMPDPWRSNYQTLMLQVDHALNPPPLTGTWKPQKGKLLIFPSTMVHRVKPLLQREDRYSVAFNTFPSGNIGEITNITAKLQISAKSVEEMFSK